MTAASLLTIHPRDTEHDVDPDVEIFAAYSLGTFQLLPSATVIKVDGATAYAAGAFAYPAWRGSWTFDPVTNTGFVRFAPRRRFLYGVKVTVAVTLGTSPDGETATPTVLPDVVFFTRATPAPRATVAARQTSADRPLTTPGLRGLQQVLQAGLTTPSTPSLVVVLLRRILDSPVRAYLRLLRVSPALRAAVDQLQGADVGATMTAAQLLATNTLLWDATAAELAGLGLEPPDVDALDVLWRRGHPINRLGVAAFAVTYAAVKTFGALP